MGCSPSDPSQVAVPLQQCNQTLEPLPQPEQQQQPQEDLPPNGEEQIIETHPESENLPEHPAPTTEPQQEEQKSQEEQPEEAVEIKQQEQAEQEEEFKQIKPQTPPKQQQQAIKDDNLDEADMRRKAVMANAQILPFIDYEKKKSENGQSHRRIARPLLQKDPGTPVRIVGADGESIETNIRGSISGSGAFPFGDSAIGGAAQ